MITWSDQAGISHLSWNSLPGPITKNMTKNFFQLVYTSAIRAKITIYLSYFNDFCSIGWTQIIPETIIKISRRSEKYNRESLKESVIIANYLPSEGRESRTDC